jgi:hypothetical protein
MNKRAKFGAMLAAVLVVGTLAFVYLNTQYVADPATGDATLSWAPPTERVDGTPLETVSGYRIYYGRDPKQFEHEIEVDREVTKYRIENLESGDWYFAVAAISEEGLESAPSSVMQKTIEEPRRSLVAVR